nr:6880_t:CDS:2 [Entrophospora candida]
MIRVPLNLFTIFRDFSKLTHAFPSNNQNDFSTLPLTNNFHQYSNESTLGNTTNYNPNQYSPPQFPSSQQNTQTFPNYQNFAAATNINNTTANIGATTNIAGNDVNNMRPLASTQLLNNPFCENNNNIIWLLTRLEKRIDQMEQNRHQRIFASNTLSQNNAFDNGNKISYDDVYNILGKLFTRIERLETSQINVERNLAELNKFYFNQN